MKMSCRDVALLVTVLRLMLLFCFFQWEC